MSDDPPKGLLGTLGSAVRWLVQQSVGAVLTAIVLIFAGPTIIKSVSDSYPSCERPVGLTRAALSAQDTVSGAGAPPPSSGNYAPDFYGPVKAFDQNLRTVWALPREALAAQATQQNSFELDLHQPMDVVLVCAINGAPLDPNSYQRADRVREATVTYVCSDGERKQQVYLQSRSDGEMQLAQQIGSRCEGMSSMSMHVTASYEGWDVTRLGSDQVENATGRVALADIVFYQWGDDLNLSQRFIKLSQGVWG